MVCGRSGLVALWSGIHLYSFSSCALWTTVGGPEESLDCNHRRRTYKSQTSDLRQISEKRDVDHRCVRYSAAQGPW